MIKEISRLKEFQIRDYIDDPKWVILKEGKVGGRKSLEVEGRFQYANKKNQNGRLYPFKILTREIQKLMPSIERRRVYGELDHPEILETSLKNASHVITKLWMDGNEMKGRFEILGTPNGNILRNLYESNTQPGVSSRGAGRAIERDGYYEIASDFELKTFDAVADPSTHEAYPTMLSESQIIRTGKQSPTQLNKRSELVDFELMYLSGELYGV